MTPSYNWTWDYLRLIIRHLEAVGTGECPRLMLAMPPRHGKSELTTIRYPVYRMETEPTTRVCVGAYNQEFANRFGRRSRRIAEGRFQISGERAAAREWETESGGVYRSCGVGSPPTGEGFNLMVIDDPVKSRAEANSTAYRERVWEWYTNDLYTRLEPGGAVILIMTRWHEDDLAGRLLAAQDDGGDQWAVLSLPALAQDNDPLGREQGEALCPARYDTESLQRRRAVMGDHSFEALYQQNPTPLEGSMFKVENIVIADAPPANLKAVRGWDMAATDGGGDYTVGVKMADGGDGTFWVLDMRRGQWDSAVRDKEMRLCAELDGKATRIRLPQDPGQAGKSQIKSMERLLAGFAMNALPVSGDKSLRAGPLASQVNAGNLRLVRGDWNSDFIEELRQFPGGKNDDIVDAAADAFDELTINRGWTHDPAAVKWLTTRMKQGTSSEGEENGNN